MFDKENFKLSVLIPCYNEVNSIDLILNKVLENLKLYNLSNYEIVIVDDFSNDGTRKKLQALSENQKFKIILHDHNQGKGAAIRTGINNINSDILIIQDADLEYDPSDYKKLLVPFFETDADIVYGSRFLGGGKYVRIHFFWHYLANKILTFICNLFTNLNLTDMETGYKVFKTSVIKTINVEENSFSIEPEVTIKLAKKKFRFYEVPITYNGRSYEEGKKIALKDAFIALKAIILYTFKS
jgi:glycosyltransferase involved in cell wall biosynthesis|tara:strand:- start:91 stop:813 length:723 start_codon:yes stop_codon:yes gene_type:complete